jgi:hypothetical protein
VALSLLLVAIAAVHAVSTVLRDSEVETAARRSSTR